MDNLSSSDLDSPSKTPLFIAIAAGIIALVGLWLGWLGFSRSAELEQQLAALGDASERLSAVEDLAGQQGGRVDQLGASLNSLSKEVSRVLGEVEGDITKLKRNVRTVAIDAGTAKRMVEALEKQGVKVAAPAPRVSSASKSTNAPVASRAGGVYKIKSGDNFGKIAAAYKISLTRLIEANPGVDSRRLRIGQEVVIPASK